MSSRMLPSHLLSTYVSSGAYIFLAGMFNITENIRGYTQYLNTDIKYSAITSFDILPDGRNISHSTLYDLSSTILEQKQQIIFSYKENSSHKHQNIIDC
jgi:hypothetical protein